MLINGRKMKVMTSNDVILEIIVDGGRLETVMHLWGTDCETIETVQTR